MLPHAWAIYNIFHSRLLTITLLSQSKRRLTHLLFGWRSKYLGLSVIFNNFRTLKFSQTFHGGTVILYESWQERTTKSHTIHSACLMPLLSLGSCFNKLLSFNLHWRKRHLSFANRWVTKPLRFTVKFIISWMRSVKTSIHSVFMIALLVMV